MIIFMVNIQEGIFIRQKYRNYKTNAKNKNNIKTKIDKTKAYKYEKLKTKQKKKDKKIPKQENKH